MEPSPSRGRRLLRLCGRIFAALLLLVASGLLLGDWLTPRIGLRFNAAWDDNHSYVDHADGRRNFYSLASDWLIGSS